MKIAVAGKGGSGKTTIAGTLARCLARRGVAQVLAIDADSNPNLALTLGLSREAARALVPLPRGLVERVTDPDGRSRTVLARPVDDIVRDHGVTTPGGIALLLMGRVDHAAAG